MDPITLAIIGVSILITGAGAGGAGVAHSKNKKISVLQNEIRTLQEQIIKYQQTIHELVLKIDSLENRVSEYRDLIIKTQSRIKEYQLELKRRESVSFLISTLTSWIYYLLTLRWTQIKNSFSFIKSSKKQLNDNIQFENELLARNQIELESLIENLSMENTNMQLTKTQMDSANNKMLEMKKMYKVAS